MAEADQRRKYYRAEVDTAVANMANPKTAPAPTQAEPTKGQTFSRAPQTPAQQEQLRQLLEKQKALANSLRK